MKNLKNLRTSFHLSQSELSDLLHISQQSICKYEKGHSEANETFLIQIADFFGTSVDYLLGRCNLLPSDDSSTYHSCITHEEIFHLNLYRTASKEQQQAIDTLLKSCIHSSKKSNQLPE